MPKATQAVPQSHIETRAKNKTTHPGKVVTSSQQPRRTKEEVEQEKNAKRQARKDLEEARQQSINRAAEFERADIANEDVMNSTPRPLFTPKPRPRSRNQRPSSLTPIADTSNVEASDVPDATPLMAGSEDLVDADDTALEAAMDIYMPLPPAKKRKGKAPATKHVPEPRPVASEDEDQQPKPKKLKAKMRDEINIAVNSMELSRNPASKDPSQRPLKREGAIADMKKFIVGEKEQARIADKHLVPDLSTRRDPDR